MAYEHPGAGALDYFSCRYGTSKLICRGPRQRLDKPYCAVIGGSETYGKFIPRPYPQLVQEATGIRLVNLGCVNAGLDVYVNDAAVLDICSRAQVTVIQIMGAANMSNRFYAVHPRRNDRFLRASQLLQALYREVDFAEFNFTRHMLNALRRISPEKFALVRGELQTAWVARMTSLVRRVEGRVLLFWLADHAPTDEIPDSAAIDDSALGPDPLLVTRAMVDAIRPHVAGYAQVVPTAAAQLAGTTGMVFAPLDAPAARTVPGPAVHFEAALELGRALKEIL